MLRITSKTDLDFTDPKASKADITTNQWIKYSGVQQEDGTVLLDFAGIAPNKVKDSEADLIKRTDYDPDKVSVANRQGGASKFFKSTDVKRIAPYGNEDMLARVQRIGTRLIPAYQRALAEDDPSKIHFRFQVVDAGKWGDAVSLPSGVIVVPKQLLERMQNDDQLATVLADNIAELLEKDTLRNLPVMHMSTAAELAGDVVGIAVPGVGLLGLASGAAEQHVIDSRLAQSGRVSLGLLHDTGYDIRQAPLAWWILAGKPGKPLDKVKLPTRAVTLFREFGTTWRSVLEHTPAATVEASAAN